MRYYTIFRTRRFGFTRTLREPLRLRHLRHVLSDDVAFEVHHVADFLRAERRVLRRRRNEVDGEPVFAKTRDSERHAVDCNRALENRLRRKNAATPDLELEVAPLRDLRGDCAAAVHMTLHDVSAHRVARAKRALQVHLRSRHELAEPSARLGFSQDVRREARAFAPHDSEAHAVHRDRLALLERLRPRFVRGDLKDEPSSARDALDRSDSLYQSCEHKRAPFTCAEPCCQKSESHSSCRRSGRNRRRA